MAYEQAKAEAFNRARAQGLNQADALAAAGITTNERFSYSLDPTGKIGPREQIVTNLGRAQGSVTQSTTDGSTDSQGNPVEVLTGSAAASARAEEAAFYQTGAVPLTPYAQTATASASTITRREYTETSTTVVSGGGSTTIVATPSRATPASQALDAQSQQTLREIEALQLANSGFAPGPQLSEQQQAANEARILALQQQYNTQRDSAESAKIPGVPSINTVPNTTTTYSTVSYQSSSVDSSVSSTTDPGLINRSTQGLALTQAGELSRDSAVNPASDPSQFPAYDDNGNLQLGFAINEETGETYYKGLGPPTQQTAGFDPYYDEFAGLDAAIAAQRNAQSLNDPYYGLTPQQLQSLGAADPTDPYIRARLGIPQLPGSTLFATSGFGTIKTGVPAIDSALGIISKIPAIVTGLVNAVGGLFGPKPTVNTAGATIGAGIAGLAQTVTGPATKDTPVSPASDPSQFPAYDDDGNLQPGFAINEETGQTYYKGLGPATKDTPVNPASDPSQFPAYDDNGNLQPGFAINPESGQPYYRGFPQPTNNANVNLNADSGYGANLAYTPVDTAALSADAITIRATTPNLSPDAQKNLENINEASANIVEAQGNIQSNNLNILRAEESIATARETQRQAEAIIAQNNAELADPLITEERRAELLANNAEQQASIAENAAFIETQNQYIEEVQANTAEQQGNILENELVVDDNATAFIENNGGVVLTVDPDVDPELQQPPDAEFEIAALAEPVDPDADPELQEPPGTEFVYTELAEPVDPDADPELLGGPDAEIDPFAPLELPPGVDPETDPELLGGPEEELVLLGGPDPVPPSQAGPIGTPYDDDGFLNPGWTLDENNNPVFVGGDFVEPATAESAAASREAAVKAQAKKQATVQARYKQPGNKDWRVRLSLGPGAQYLYNATPAGILAPLRANGGTDGVIFPYTPTISTNYSANYEQYDLIHSNYRGLFYKNSRVGDISLRGTFTAQDTTEANYLLAVIHFFRSVTKMFYGQDTDLRGTPPPICLLNGFGGYQFSDHPVVVSSFSYNLPNDVDYIRTTNPNNFGLNLNNRYNPAGASLPAGGSLAGLNRLLNAIPGGLSKGALPRTPAPNTVAGSVTNNVPASYVPTKMEIDVTLIPVQSRSQVSQQFSLKGFANGDLLKGGFW